MEATRIKEEGNSCLKQEKYEEAVLHYTQAIKLDPKNYSLYSNRSLAFLKMQHYFLALEDAKEVIRLKPDWAKGYYRKAEVEFQTFNFNDALLSYRTALILQPNDPALEDAIKKTKIALKKEKASDDQVPWIGAAIGIFIGAIIVVADQIFTLKPILGNPILMVLLTVAIAILGYLIAKASRTYIKCQRTALLEPPANLIEDEEPQKINTINKDREMRNRYTKAQANQRFKKGKL